VLAIYVIASTQEYARAKLGGLGVSDLGVVTPAERPVRASFIFIALVSYALGLDLAFLALLVLLVLQILSFYLVIRFAHNSLRNDLSA
jgi:CDP-diacylglycerol--glycerol-3-phosphate 3-phosphatidyltransferase